MPDRPTGETEQPLEVTCPCCRTKLTIDADSGEILLQERPKTAGLSWDEALAASATNRSEAEKLFDRGLERERNADEILEKKFREALKRADKSDSPPPRIFDLD